MKSRIRTRKKSPREQTPDFSTAPAQPMFQSRPFVVQSKTAEQSQQPNLKTALQRAKRYGHNINSELGKQSKQEAKQTQTNQQSIEQTPTQLKREKKQVLGGGGRESRPIIQCGGKQSTLKGSTRPPFIHTGDTRKGKDWMHYKNLINLTRGNITAQNSGQIGHEFPVIFTFERKGNKENCQFAPVPKLIWEERIVTTENGRTTDEGWVNKYEQNPRSNTFRFWNTWWGKPAEQQATNDVFVLDTPKVGIRGGDRTVRREIDFRIGIEGDARRINLRQVIDIQAGNVITNQLM